MIDKLAKLLQPPSEIENYFIMRKKYVWIMTLFFIHHVLGIMYELRTECLIYAGSLKY